MGPSFAHVSRTQLTSDICELPLWAWMRVFSVSSGWPVTMPAQPPTVPASRSTNVRYSSERGKEGGGVMKAVGEALDDTNESVEGERAAALVEGMPAESVRASMLRSATAAGRSSELIA